ncbi:MAG: hypothetical protein IIW17_00970, partial [Clostridia bacterium]|nr:hypothetical protein [Clostridia bacterium]
GVSFSAARRVLLLSNGTPIAKAPPKFGGAFAIYYPIGDVEVFRRDASKGRAAGLGINMESVSAQLEEFGS